MLHRHTIYISLSLLLYNSQICDVEEISSEVKPYWNFRDELSVLEGLVLKNSLIIVPKILQKEILKKLHDGHVGLATSKIRARSSVFWPGLNTDLTDLVSNCLACVKYKPKNQKEPLIQHHVEKIPWYKVGIDICMLENKYYLIFIDYYSKFIEIAMLKDITSEEVILHCKSMFARYGIPVYVVSDSGSQFTSKSFKKFSVMYEFSHIITSPKFPQSNGMAESAVKIFKNIMKKCREDNTDPYIGLLNYRNTEKTYMPSPAQLFFSRNLNSLLPFSKNKLKPCVKRLDDSYLKHKDSVQKHYNKSAKSLSDLHEGQEVMYKKSDEDRDWSPGKIIQKCGQPRSYIVKDNIGNTYQRNRLHLNPLPQQPEVTENKSVSCEPLGTNVQKVSPIKEISDPNIVTTRSGRVVKKVNRLDL